MEDKLQKKIRVLMCGSDFSVGGGMVAVTRPYLEKNSISDAEITYVSTHKNGNAVTKSLVFMKAYIKIWFLLMLKKIDIAHLHTTFNGSFYRKTMIMNLCQRHGVKVILHHHIFYERFFETGDNNRKNYIKNAFSRADMNLVLGTQLETWMKKICPNANIQVVHNGVSVPEENPYNPEGKYIMFLGWFVERKGIDDFLEMIKCLENRIPKDISFVLCGGEESEIADKITELGIRTRIAFIGRVTPEQRDELFNKTMLNVLPSYNEGLPMTILETMAHGIPNIATKIAAIPDVIQDGVNGYLIEPGDVNDLSNKVARFVNDFNLRQELSNMAYTEIKENFSLRKNIKKISDLYHTIYHG